LETGREKIKTEKIMCLQTDNSSPQTNSPVKYGQSYGFAIHRASNKQPATLSVFDNYGN
jgi:hypothetical protein